MTQGSAVGSPALLDPAFSGLAGLWLPAGCCSMLGMRSVWVAIRGIIKDH